MSLEFHTGVYGMTGTGKTTLVKKRIAREPRVLWLDVNDEASQHGRVAGPLRERMTATELSLHPAKLLESPLSLAVVPDKPTHRARAQLLKMVWELLERIATQRRANRLVLVLDELGDYADACLAELRTLATRALTHLQAQLIVIAQRPALVPKTVRSQMGELIVFHLEEVDDADAATERMKPDPKKFSAQVQALPARKSITWRPSLASTSEPNPAAQVEA